MLRLDDYPQLRLIAWHRRGVEEIDEQEAFALYEARWRHIDEATLTAKERELIRQLAQRWGAGVLNV
jgi:hypothetical protein